MARIKRIPVSETGDAGRGYRMTGPTQGPSLAQGSRAAGVAQLLLPYLREVLRAPDLRYVEPPRSIAVGVETWVYGLELTGGPQEFSGPLVLRVFPAGDDPNKVRLEETVQNTVNDLDYPAPRVPLTCVDPAVLGGPFLLMARVPGRMMLDAIATESVRVANVPCLVLDVLRDVPEILVRAQLRLHRLDASSLQRAFESAGLPEKSYTVDGWIEDVDARIARARIEGLRPAAGWVKANHPVTQAKPVICHADFLPPNIMIDKGQLSGVIDWSHATIAPAEWDIANTRLRIRFNPFPMPALVKPVASVLRPLATRRYDRAYKRERDVDEQAIRYYEVLIGLWLLLGVAESRLAKETLCANDGRAINPWLEPGSTRPLIRYLQRVTNTPISLPMGSE